MEPEMIARAQYDSRAARLASTLASKYLFETPIEEDEQGDYYHHLIITRVSDGTVVADQRYYALDALNDAIEGWRVSLNLSALNTAMMGL